MENSEPNKGLYKIGSFSAMTGLSSSVLRAWERRHNLLEPERLEGGHRLYTELDLRTIRRVNELLQEGRTIGEIAAIGRQQLLSIEERKIEPEVQREDQNRLQEYASKLVLAAKALDHLQFDEILDGAFAMFRTDRVIREVVHPAAVEVGELWAAGELSIAAEHMLSAALISRIDRLRQGLTASSKHARLVVCACPSGEQHELGILILSLFIESAGYRVAYLGRDLPLDELKQAAEQLDAKAVCLSVKLKRTLMLHQPEIEKLSKNWSGRIRLHLGGPGVIGYKPTIENSDVHTWPPDFTLQTFLDKLFVQNDA